MKCRSKIKEEKCDFLKVHLQYLGHFLLGKGIRSPPKILSGIKTLTLVYTLKQVH